MLEVLIVHMIRAGITDKDSFVYYEKAVLRGIRITRLYEFYMASIRKDISIRLPKIVLMYFTYDSGVNYTWKSYLLPILCIIKSSIRMYMNLMSI